MPAKKSRANFEWSVLLIALVSVSLSVMALTEKCGFGRCLLKCQYNSIERTENNS